MEATSSLLKAFYHNAVFRGLGAHHLSVQEATDLFRQLADKSGVDYDTLRKSFLDLIRSYEDKGGTRKMLLEHMPNVTLEHMIKPEDWYETYTDDVLFTVSNIRA